MKIVFTGGTHVGKTTILNLCKANGYNVFQEVAVKNMAILIKLLGIEDYKKWRVNNFLEFQKMNIISVLQRDFDLDDEEINLLDRGVFDFIASLKREKIEIPLYLEELVKKVEYDLILFFEPLPVHNTRKETGRMLDLEKSKLWAKYIYNEYVSRFGQDKVIEVPYFEENDLEKNIEKRYEFVISILKKHSI